VERFELFIVGRRAANSFQNLPISGATAATEQAARKAAGDLEAQGMKIS